MLNPFTILQNFRVFLLFVFRAYRWSCKTLDLVRPVRLTLVRAVFCGIGRVLLLDLRCLLGSSDQLGF